MTRELLVNPITIDVSPGTTTAETVAQTAYRCDAESKAALAVELIKGGKWEQVLVFTRTKHGANRLSKRLDQSGIQSSAIHGDKSQGARTRRYRDSRTERYECWWQRILPHVGSISPNCLM